MDVSYSSRFVICISKWKSSRPPFFLFLQPFTCDAKFVDWAVAFSVLPEHMYGSVNDTWLANAQTKVCFEPWSPT